MKFNKTLFVLALGAFGITTTEFGVIGILPQIAGAFHIGIDRAGLLLSVFAIVVALSGPFMVIALNSFNRKALMFAALMVFMVANLLSACAPGFYFLLFIRMIPALLHPVYWSVALSAATRNAGPSHSARAKSVVFSGLTIATVLGVPMATFIADLLNWQASFIFSALINLLAALGLIFFLPDTGEVSGVRGNNKYEILKKSLLWLNIVLSFFIITAMYSTYGYMADFLHNVFGMDARNISFLLFLFGLMGIGGNKLAGRFMIRYPFYTVLVFILAMAICHTLLYIIGKSMLTVAMVVSIWGFIHAGGFLIANITVTASTDKAPEILNSIFTSCGNFAVTVGSLLGGFFISRFGVENIVWSSIACFYLSLLVLLFKRKLYPENFDPNGKQ